MAGLKGIYLDPYQNIINVHWSGAKILVLTCEYDKNFMHPKFEVIDLPLDPPLFDMFDQTIYYEVDPNEHPLIENPITSEMLQFIRIWNKPPYKVGTADNIFIGRCLIFFNIKRIRSELPKEATEFVFKIRTPATGGATGQSGDVYYVWNPVGLPFPGVEPYTFGAAIEFDSVWTTAGDAAIRANNLIPVHQVIPYPVNTIIPDSLTWQIQVSSYKKKKDFPDDERQPDWDVDIDSVSHTEIGFSGTSDNPLNSKTIKVTLIFETLDIAFEVTDS